MHAIGLLIAICGGIVAAVGTSSIRNSYLRRTEQPRLRFDASQKFAWVRSLNASETRRLYLVQAASCALLLFGFATATGAFG